MSREQAYLTNLCDDILYLSINQAKLIALKKRSQIQLIFIGLDIKGGKPTFPRKHIPCESFLSWLGNSNIFASPRTSS